MIEVTLKEYIESNITEPVYLDIPINPAKKYVTIEKMGAGKRNKIEACTMSIDAVATSKYEAALLSQKIKEIMEELGESDIVFSTDLGGESDRTITSQKKYCYNTVWNIYF